jgi:upstream activation factor subunit UAF30
MSLEQISQDVTALRSELKSLAKVTRKIMRKLEDPDGSKAAERAKNNGFNRKNRITDTLQQFLGVEPGSMVSRSEVTKFISAYINDKGLKSKENGREIVLDDKLRALLNPPADETLTFLNLQKYLSPHYIK